MAEGFSAISQAELEDFRNAIENSNHDFSHYEINESPASTSSEGGGNIHGIVTIKYIINKKEKTYQTGAGSTWTVDFQLDLEQGVFD